MRHWAGREDWANDTGKQANCQVALPVPLKFLKLVRLDSLGIERPKGKAIFKSPAGQLQVSIQRMV
jgi:hypothetical protein